MQMNGGMIPHQHKALREKAQEMFQHDHDLIARHAPSKVAFEDAAGQGQPDRGRETPPLPFHPSQDRTVSTRGPRRAESFLKGKPEFVKKDDFNAVPPRFF